MGAANCKCNDGCGTKGGDQQEDVGEILPQMAALPTSQWNGNNGQGAPASPRYADDGDGPVTFDDGVNLEQDLLEDLETESAIGDDEAAICTLTQQDKQVGDHVCPVLGKKSVGYFVEKDKLSKLMEASGEDLGRTFSLDSTSISATTKGRNGGFACAVSDPEAADCPLVYVSNGFEDLTGYTSSFATGRSCRFLQPTIKVLNDAINLEERKLMREFCSTSQPVGTTLVNLLLNQRFTGERFWNLLRMQYVEVDGDMYIFAVQTNLDAYMPKVLQKAVKTHAKNERIVGAIGGFIEALARMRTELRAMVNTPMMELKGYFTASMNCLQMLPLISTGAMAGANLEKPIGVMAVSSKTSAPATQYKAGDFIEVVQTIKYPSFAVPKGTRGKILSIDSFGNLVVEFQNSKIGTKDILKRDFPRLKPASRKSPPSQAKGGLDPIKEKKEEQKPVDPTMLLSFAQ